MILEEHFIIALTYVSRNRLRAM